MAAEARCRNSTFAFMHQQKAGGMSVRAIMGAIVASHPRRLRLQESPARFGECPCTEPAERKRTWFFSDQGPFCPECPDLQWATIFREPLPRLRSAFYFCQTTEGRADHETCSTGYPDEAGSICAFGRAWGSLAFSKFAHAEAPELEAIVARCPERAAGRAAAGGRGRRPRAPSETFRWAYRLQRCGLNGLRTAEGRRLFALVNASLRALNVGLLERWPAAMAKFAAQSGCAGWAAAPHQRVYHASLLRSSAAGASALVRRAERELAGCRRELLEEHLAADVLLYAEAERVFDEQWAALGEAAKRGSK